MIHRQPSTTSNVACTAPVIDQAYGAIAHLAEFYPGFDGWFWDKMVPGLEDGSRRLRTVVRDGETVGVSIAKRTSGERKLSTIWVAQRMKGSGLGARLIVDACGWLGTGTPFATVPEERMPEFSTILSRLGFVEYEAVEGAYRPGRREHAFNGRLSPLHT